MCCNLDSEPDLATENEILLIHLPVLRRSMRMQKKQNTWYILSTSETCNLYAIYQVVHVCILCITSKDYECRVTFHVTTVQRRKLQ